MLKAFQYTSIALLCSMAVACSSGKGNSVSQSQQSNKPMLEKPQTGKTEKQHTPKQDTPSEEMASPPPSAMPTPPIPKEMPSQFVVIAQEAKIPGGHTNSVQSDDYKHHIGDLISVAEEGGVNFKHTPKTLEAKDVKGNVDDDVGLSLLNANAQIASGFGKVHSVNIKGEHILLARDADLNNWKYQNFGMITIPRIGSSAFVSFGQESKSIPQSGSATYTGIALGSARQGQNAAPIDSVSGQIASDVEMIVNFSDKSLTFTTSNTKGYSVSGAESDVSARIIDYSNDWDLKGTAMWSNEQKAFVGNVQLKSDGEGVQPAEGSSLKGSFYGPDAVEIGGTFHLKTNDKDYRGAFGGKKGVKATEAATVQP